MLPFSEPIFIRKSYRIYTLSILEVSKNITDVDDEYDFFRMKFHISFTAFKTTLVKFHNAISKNKTHMHK